MLSANVKIVIWDLDETFWDGTLSEGEVKRIESNINIVQELVDRGIMCSIVSKNNFEDVKAQLEKWNIWDLFIFPHISWMPKGEQVKHLLEVCSLRADNALFIDDNISNIKEVEFYNPRIMTSLPEILNEEFLNIEQLKGKNDKNHSRLKQYKVLELRNSDESKFSSNEEFLRSSSITISVLTNCCLHFDRIEELIQRTNQLNYTKNRIGKDEIERIIKDTSFSCGCVSVSDNYGEYGIVGFYALKNNKLEHFVFSCRTIGLGVENYLYKKLGYPNITVIGDVSTELSKEYAERIDWINECEDNVDSEKINKNKPSFLMIAGCDLDQACAYIESNYEIRKEFTTVIEGREIRTSDTSQILNAIDLPKEDKDELCKNLPFFENGVSFDSEIFTGRFRTIVISVVDDYIRGIWKHKTKGYYIGYGGYYDQVEFLKKLTHDEKLYLKNNFDFVGKENVSIFRNNLERIVKLVGTDTHIILINGIDLDVSDWIGNDRIERNLEMNKVVDEIVSQNSNIDLLDMRTIVNDRKHLPNKDNRHFDRYVYYMMAKKLSELCGTEEIEIDSYARVETKKFLSKALNKLKRGFHK